MHLNFSFLRMLAVVGCVLMLAACSGVAVEDSKASNPSTGGSSNNSSNSSSGGNTNSGSNSSSNSSSGSNGGSGENGDPSGSSSSSSGAAIGTDQAYFYFSYDDAASTASRDLSHFYIKNNFNPRPSWGRSYEFLNAEKFEHFMPETYGDFSISVGLHQSDISQIPVREWVNSDESVYHLGVNISGPRLEKEDRPNIVLTLLVDISGSMGRFYADRTPTDVRSLMDVVKHGLGLLEGSLKAGDVINLITFETTVNVVLENLQFDPSDTTELNMVIENLTTQGSTALNDGIEAAYLVARRTYDADKSNRIVMLTDAEPNTGEVDPKIISDNLVINELEGIHFSGVGIGSQFNDKFLNELTDIGKGGYFAMVTPEDAERIFSEGFVRFIDDAVSDIQFKLSYPESFRYLAASSSAEQVSQDPDEVQTTNFAFNSEQFFLEKFAAKDLVEGEKFILEIEFDGVDERQILKVEKTVDELLGNGRDEIVAASSVAILADLVGWKIHCNRVNITSFLDLDSESSVYIDYKALITQFCSSP